MEPTGVPHLLWVRAELRIKPRRRLMRERPEASAVPDAPNAMWPMDFMPDRLSGGRCSRTFNVLDGFNREGLGVGVDLSLPAERVARALEQIIEWRGEPQSLRRDNGPKTGKPFCLMPGQATRNGTLTSRGRTALCVMGGWK